MDFGIDSAEPEQAPMLAEMEAGAVLRLKLDSARQELLDAIAQIPAIDRSARVVCGVWTTRDLVGHIADWEQVGVEGVRLMAAGQAPAVGRIEDIEAWNQAHARARQEQPWDVVSEDLDRIRHDLLEILERMSSSELERVFPFPWDEEGRVHDWISVFVHHDQEHAADLRAAGVPTGRESEA
jgi:hypothetical protein